VVVAVSAICIYYNIVCSLIKRFIPNSGMGNFSVRLVWGIFPSDEFVKISVYTTFGYIVKGALDILF